MFRHEVRHVFRHVLGPAEMERGSACGNGEDMCLRMCADICLDTRNERECRWHGRPVCRHGGEESEIHIVIALYSYGPI